MKYHDLDNAIKQYLELLANHPECSELLYVKSDCLNAFRILPVKIHQRKFLVMKANDPGTNETWYFMDKCL